MQPSHIEHIGIAVTSLDESIPFFEKLLGTKCYAIEEVADQKVKTAFLRCGFLALRPDQNRAFGAHQPRKHHRQVHREQQRSWWHAPHRFRRGEHRRSSRRGQGTGHPPHRPSPARRCRRPEHRLPAPEIDLWRADRTV